MSAYTAWNSESLLVEWNINRASIAYRERNQHEIEAELKRRMLADGATVLPDARYICELKTPTPKVDYAKLHALRELLPPDVIAEGYMPTHEETVLVPERWNMVQVNAWGRKYGTEVAAVIEGAKIPGEPRVSIKRKEA